MASKRKRLAVVSAWLVFLLSASAFVATDASAAQGNCVLNKAAYRTEKDGVTSPSTEWVVMSKTAVKFTQGGPGRSCVIVRFSGLPRATYIMRIRAVLDGEVIATPPEVQFEYDSPGYLSVRAFEFVFPKVKPGKHIVRIEWVAHPGFPNTVYRRTVTVQHR